MIPVATYSRVSDPAQERGTSLDTQTRRCLEYCQAHHYTVVVSESESEGGEFIHARSRFHSLVARSDIQKIVVDIPDRLGRGKARSILEYIAAEAGKEIATRPFQLVTGRNWRGTAFGGAKGRTDVPKIVDMYMTGKIEIDPMITHVMGLEDINKAFELMHAGESIRSVVVF